jgi:NAD(P)-dependent dehydrogenase (short-subunit alcohol dehydrogenase family)
MSLLKLREVFLEWFTLVLPELELLYVQHILPLTLQNITKTLCIEWAPYNIKINSVAPGVIVSSGTDRYGDYFLESARKATPLQKLGTCEEVSHLIAFLVSEKASSFITGQTYYIGTLHKV